MRFSQNKFFEQKKNIKSFHCAIYICIFPTLLISLFNSILYTFISWETAPAFFIWFFLLFFFFRMTDNCFLIFLRHNNIRSFVPSQRINDNVRNISFTDRHTHMQTLMSPWHWTRPKSIRFTQLHINTYDTGLAYEWTFVSIKADCP